MESKLKIGIGTITPHDAAGFSGGSKILVPGVAGTQTARYFHDFLKGAKLRGGSVDNDFRRELDIITGDLGLNFIANVILNYGRQIAALVAGDRVLAHWEGAIRAAELFAVMPVTGAQIIVANTYPPTPTSGLFPAATLSRDWHELCDALRAMHRDGPIKVAVYPCAPLQYAKDTGDDR